MTSLPNDDTAHNHDDVMMTHFGLHDTDTGDMLGLNTSLLDVCGLPQIGDSAPLQGSGLAPALAAVVPCTWTRFPRPGLAIVGSITLFYVIVGLSGILLNGLVIILYLR